MLWRECVDCGLSSTNEKDGGRGAREMLKRCECHSSRKRLAEDDFLALVEPTLTFVYSASERFVLRSREK